MGRGDRIHKKFFLANQSENEREFTPDDHKRFHLTSAIRNLNGACDNINKLILYLPEGLGTEEEYNALVDSRAEVINALFRVNEIAGKMKRRPLEWQEED